MVKHFSELERIAFFRVVDDTLAQVFRYDYFKLCLILVDVVDELLGWIVRL